MMKGSWDSWCPTEVMEVHMGK